MFIFIFIIIIILIFLGSSKIDTWKHVIILIFRVREKGIPFGEGVSHKRVSRKKSGEEGKVQQTRKEDC